MIRYLFKNKITKVEMVLYWITDKIIQVGTYKFVSERTQPFFFSQKIVLIKVINNDIYW